MLQKSAFDWGVSNLLSPLPSAEVGDTAGREQEINQSFDDQTFTQNNKIENENENLSLN